VTDQLHLAETSDDAEVLEALGVQGETKRVRRLARARFFDLVLGLAPGVVFAPPEELDRVEAVCRRLNVPVHHISTPGGYEDFFWSVRETFPLDPLIVSARSWDALSDSMRGGLYHVDDKRIVLLWRDSAGLRESDPKSYEIALNVLGAVSWESAERLAKCVTTYISSTGHPADR
jgi:hypothetical protein